MPHNYYSILYYIILRYIILYYERKYCFGTGLLSLSDMRVDIGEPSTEVPEMEPRLNVVIL